MDRKIAGGEPIRPPPTVPKVHPQKKQRREGPPGALAPRGDRYSPPPPRSPSAPASLKRMYDDEDGRGSNPPHLGGYPIQRKSQHGQSPSIDFKTRGFGPPKTEDGSDDEDFGGSFWNFKRVFKSAGTSILAQADHLESISENANLPSHHPNYHDIETIRFQLEKLADAYYPMVDEVKGYENALKDFASQEDTVARSRAELRSVAFKLDCKQTELDQSAAREDDLRRRLEDFHFKLASANKEVSDLKATNRQLSRVKEEHERCVSREKELRRELDGLRAADSKLSGFRKQLSEYISREGKLQKEIKDLKATNHSLSCAKKELSDEVHELKATAADMERKIQDLRATNGQLMENCGELQSELQVAAGDLYAVRGRETEIEQVRAENDRLQTQIREREAEVQEAMADSLRLQGLVHEKEAQIAALPATPLSPLVRLPFPALGPPVQLPSRQSSTPYIKQEAPDQTLQVGAIASQIVPAEQPLDTAQQLSQLGSGLVEILTKVFHITRRNGYDDVIVGFIQRLGAAPEPSQIAINSTASFWQLQQTWTANPSTPPDLPPTLDEQFAHLCLLFPFLPTQSHDDTHTTLITSLLNTLISADHSASPRAALAFLQTMTALLPAPLTSRGTATTTASESEPGPSLPPTTTLLHTIMLCELCRALEQSFPDEEAYVSHKRRYWDIGSILGHEVHEAVEKMPIGRLAAALREPGRREGVGSLKERLVEWCGDLFCPFVVVVQGQQGGGGGGGGGGDWGEREMGLLYCDEGWFLMVDFTGRELRLVECGLADMEPNKRERKRFDLVVLREGGEELFRLEAAPREVMAFWVKYVIGGD